MNKKTNEEWQALVNKATAGDKQALETLVADVQDVVFNLSLRMLGTFSDAEDATQDILLKMITHLSSFRGDSAFPTWAFRIAFNHLKNYKKHLFARYPLSFEYYGADIENGKIRDVPDLTQNVERAILAEELKLSCTNVMLNALTRKADAYSYWAPCFKWTAALREIFWEYLRKRTGSGFPESAKRWLSFSVSIAANTATADANARIG